MKAEIKLYTNQKRKNGYPVIFYYQFKNIRKRISLGWYFQKDEWDFINQVPLANADNYEFVYPKILNFRQKFKSLLFEGETDIEIYKAEFEKKPTSYENFYSFADKLIEDLKHRNQVSNAKVYKTAITQFKKVYDTLLFKELDYTILRDFKNYKLKNGAKNSTVHNYLRTMRAIYNEAVRQKVVEDTNPFKDAFKDIVVRKNRTKKKYLTIESIEKLERLKDLPPGQQFTLDLFLLQFYFGGQDLIDIYYLKKDQLKGHRVFFERKKLGEKGYEFDLRIIEKAEVIIAKYATPGVFVFPGRKDFKGYEGFRRRYQKNLLLLQVKASVTVEPKGTNLGIKVARYSFANRGKLLGINEDVLRELMGHERKDVDTIYKDTYPQKLRDKCHKLIVNK